MFKGLFVNIFEGQGLVVILENNWAILKKVRGLFRIKFIWWKGLFWNIIEGRVSFEKGLERWKGT